MSIYTVLDDRDKILLEDKIKESSEQFNIKTAEGQHIVINDSADFSFMGMKLYGKTTQVTTTGKQLFDASNYLAGLGIGTSEGGTYSDSTVFSTNYISVKNLGSIAWSGYSSEDGKVTFGAFYDANKVFISSFAIQAKTVDIPSNAYFVRITFKNECLKTLMINEGTEVLPLESFSNGYASPSPQYEQPLESVGKWGNYLNLADKTIEIRNYVYEKAEIDIPIGTYTFSCNHNVSQGVNWWIEIYDADQNAIVPYSLMGYSENKRTFTLTTRAKYITIYVDSAVTMTNIMLNEGTTPLPYRPYSGQKDVESGVYGGNLLPYPWYSSSGASNGVTFTDNGDGSLTLNGTATPSYPTMILVDDWKPSVGIYSKSVFDNVKFIVSRYIRKTNTYDNIAVSEKTITFDTSNWDYDVYCYKVIVQIAIGVTLSTTIFPMINKGDILLPWTPYTKQSHISLVGDGLKGIPVTDASLATYTDENGQMWCADYVDCERGVLVQNIKAVVLDGTESWYIQTGTNNENFTLFQANTSLSGSLNQDVGQSSHFKYINFDRLWSLLECGLGVSSNKASFRIKIDNDIASTAEELKTWLADNPVTVVYPSEEPIETPMSDEEIAAYKALHANNPTTTIMNDCGVHTRVGYIDKKYDNGVKNVVEKVVGEVNDHYEYISELSAIGWSIDENRTTNDVTIQHSGTYLCYLECNFCGADNVEANKGVAGSVRINGNNYYFGARPQINIPIIQSWDNLSTAFAGVIKLNKGDVVSGYFVNSTGIDASTSYASRVAVMLCRL